MLKQWLKQPVGKIVSGIIIVIVVIGCGALWLQRAGAQQRAAGAIHEYNVAQALPKSVSAKFGKMTRGSNGDWLQSCTFKYKNHKYTYEYYYVPRTRRVTCNVYRDSWAIADSKAPFSVVPQLK